MQEGRMDREKPTRKPKRQNPFASTTNREKTKSKNFMMLKQKAKGKAKRSFKDKQVNCLLFVHLFHKKKSNYNNPFYIFFLQIALRNSLLKQKKMGLSKKWEIQYTLCTRYGQPQKTI